MKKFTKKEALTIVMEAVALTIPDERTGNLEASYNDYGEIEVYFTEDEENPTVN